jgi:hypothetical protein
VAPVAKVGSNPAYRPRSGREGQQFLARGRDEFIKPGTLYLLGVDKRPDSDQRAAPILEIMRALTLGSILILVIFGLVLIYRSLA